jgi:hypothetical protein
MRRDFPSRILDLCRSQIPTLPDGVRQAFAAADDDHADGQHTALIDELRGERDRRDALFGELRAALPAEAQATLRKFDEAWSEEAGAREEAAYLIGARVGQIHPICVDCDAERRRARDADRRRARLARSA